MAYAVLASQNESSRAHMGKIPYSNPHLNANPNPNPNPKKKQKQFHHTSTNGGGRYNDGGSPAATQAASDDAYSFNQTTNTRSGFNHGGYLSYNVASYTKSELVELRKRLASELEQIRDLRDRIDSGQFHVNGSGNNPKAQGKLKKLSGNKHPGAPFESIKDPKKFCNGFADNGNFGLENTIIYEGMLKECKHILTKLMKQKNGWIFNKPVDAVALGLLDYHLIVKRPMDLGTVKSNLAKNLYSMPTELAADVRLTFNNALLYNPKTDQVHGMAEQLLSQFEELFRPIQEKIDSSTTTQRRDRELREFRVNDELEGNPWNNHNQIIASPERGGKKSKPKRSPIPVPQTSKKLEKMQVQAPMHTHSSALGPPIPPPSPSPPVHAHTPSPVRAPLPAKEQKVGRVGTVKQPKPRAKDPNKRAMSMEEKQKLGIGLQSLPQEKMPQLVQIIRKRNEHLAQDGDEIELDIEALDTETLWELDRFVTNWKKLVSKTQRQALMINNIPAAAANAPATEDDEADVGAMSDSNEKKPRKNEDEDVDIDDDMPATNFPPVEIEKDEGGGGGGRGHDQGNGSSSSNSSSSSSSDSSSSSGSDSGSSSSSDSDADDAQS